MWGVLRAVGEAPPECQSHRSCPGLFVVAFGRGHRETFSVLWLQCPMTLCDGKIALGSQRTRQCLSPSFMGKRQEPISLDSITFSHLIGGCDAFSHGWIAAQGSIA